MAPTRDISHESNRTLFIEQVMVLQSQKSTKQIKQIASLNKKSKSKGQLERLSKAAVNNDILK